MSAFLKDGVLTAVSGADPLPVTLDTDIDATTLTNLNSTITTGGVSQTLFAANTSRKGFWIRNNSAGSLYLNRAGATATTSDFELKTGEYFETPSFERTTNAIGIIGATTGQAFSAGGVCIMPISGGTGGGVGGFDFAGNFDATPSSSATTAVFNELDSATIVSDVFTPTSYPTVGSALSTNISTNDANSPQKMRFTWPDLTTDTMIIGLCTPTSETNIQNILDAGQDTAFVGIGATSGSVLSFYKYGIESPSFGALAASVSTGDIVEMQYSPSTDVVNFVNVTTGNTVLASFSIGSSYAGFETSVSAFIYSQVAVSFDIDGLAEPLLQESNSVIAGTLNRTYQVTVATGGSIFNGKTLLVDDFVTFFDNNGTTDVMIVRLP